MTISVNKTLGWTFAALVLPALAASSGCSTNPATGRRELILISRQQEIAMGRQAAPQFEQQFGGRVQNELLQSYVTMVGRRVAGQSDRPMPYEFTLVASDVPNAFALPGGNIFITAGLMSRMTNERQLAAVLAHEIAHVAARHNVKGMQRQMGASVLVAVAGRLAGKDKATAAQDVAKVVATMANLKYSRDDEYQADRYGIKYMAKAGYNPWGMVELLEVLQGLSQSDPGLLGQMFSTHRLTGDRVERTRRIIQKDYARYSPSAKDPHAARFAKIRKILLREMSAER